MTNKTQFLKENKISKETQIVNKPQILKEHQIFEDTQIIKRKGKF
jgi:hypothetical protein